MSSHSLALIGILAGALMVPVAAPAEAGTGGSTSASGSVAVSVSSGYTAASARKPAATVSGSYVVLASGKLRVTVLSNAKKVTLTYRTAKNKKRSATVKIRAGQGAKTLAKGSKKIYAKAKATSKLKASAKVPIGPYVAPAPVIAPPAPEVVAPPAVNPTPTDTTTPSPPTTGVVQIAAGSDHNCALLNTGGVYCWGWNEFAQLGIGKGHELEFSTVPVPVSGIGDAVAITAGAFQTCAVRAGGTISCWGENSDGQLGRGDKEPTTTPVAVAGISNATAVAIGDFHTCALVAGGLVKCWGSNGYGQLGKGPVVDPADMWHLTPVDVQGVAGAVAITAGAVHTCALLADGSLSCWGSSQYGQLGNGKTEDKGQPVVPVTGIGDATAISAGQYHTCARRTSGEVWCWGRSEYGQLGNGLYGWSAGVPVTSSTPVGVSGLADATAIGGASAMHTCATRSNGAVACWGMNDMGQLGDRTIIDSATPVTAGDITGPVSVVTGSEHTCALRADRSVVCWGWNGRGQLGNGTTADSLTPVTVALP